MNLSVFQRCCRTPVSSAASAWTKWRPTLPLGASYLLVGMNARAVQQACHAWSSSIPPLSCAPSLECTQSMYTSRNRWSSSVETHPFISPVGPSLSFVLSVFSSFVVVFVTTFPAVVFFALPLEMAARLAVPLLPALCAAPLYDSPPYKFRSCAPNSGDRTLKHPQHRQSAQWRPEFQQAHRWVLQANTGPHLQQALAGSLLELFGGGVPPISVSFYSPVPSSQALERAAVDGAGVVSSASSPCLSGELAGDDVWELG